MPVIEVKMWKGRSREQKEKLAKEITESFIRIVGTTPEHVHVIFFDIEKTDWAIAGKLSDES